MFFQNSMACKVTLFSYEMKHSIGPRGSNILGCYAKLSLEIRCIGAMSFDILVT
jgi:hypothetical protein